MTEFRDISIQAKYFLNCQMCIWAHLCLIDVVVFVLHISNKDYKKKGIYNLQYELD